MSAAVSKVVATDFGTCLADCQQKFGLDLAASHSNSLSIDIRIDQFLFGALPTLEVKTLKAELVVLLTI